MVARRTMTDRWFVSIELPKLRRGAQGIRQADQNIMAARLGDLFYWLGCILAVLFLPLPLLALIDFVNGHPQEEIRQRPKFAARRAALTSSG
jgi:hypothetical protein